MERVDSVSVLHGHLLSQHEQLRQMAAVVNGALSASRAALERVDCPTGYTQAAAYGSCAPELRRGKSAVSESFFDEQHPRAEQLLLEGMAKNQRRRSSVYSYADGRMSMSCYEGGCPTPEDLMSRARRHALFRLHARLGKETFHGTVTSVRVHGSLIALGLTKYSRCEIEHWMGQLMQVSHQQTKEHPVTTPVLGCCGRPPELNDGDRLQQMPFTDFVDALLGDITLSRLELKCQQMTMTIREVLLSGDANRLVAELTHVHVDDVASPSPKDDIVTKLEPLFACAILANGLVIGLQTAYTSTKEEEGAWFWANAIFTLTFLVEVVMRLMQGTKRYMFSPDRWWNIFDCLLMLVSVCDVVLGASPVDTDLTPFGVLRVARLLRVTRLFRLFRMKYMRELNLMVRGLMRGVYTLFWAVVVLFFTLFVIAVTATTTIGDTILASGGPPAEEQLHFGSRHDLDLMDEIVREQLFSSLPRSFFTAFRCFMGDCTTARGYAIVPILTENYGFSFVLVYVAATVFVVFGVFNLVAAVYVENTMNAAKTDGEKTKAERHRESVRIARLTRQLLKKFCAAQKLTDDPLTPEVRNALRTSAFDDMGDVHLSISKEVFLCIIQDPSVQALMDELDIPPDRAGLFDVLDSDCSGGLEVAELITGLLQVRGEAKKRDILGALLAVRASQGMLRDQEDRLARVELLLEELATRQRKGLETVPALLHGDCSMEIYCSQRPAQASEGPPPLESL